MFADYSSESIPERVKRCNAFHLQWLPGKTYYFRATDEGAMEETIDCPVAVDEVLELKKHAIVILLANLDPANGLVKGARGRVVDFTRRKTPVVEFFQDWIMGQDGKWFVSKPVVYEVFPYKWFTSLPGGSHTREQIPLTLGWACESEGVASDHFIDRDMLTDQSDPEIPPFDGSMFRTVLEFLSGGPSTITSVVDPLLRQRLQTAAAFLQLDSLYNALNHTHKWDDHPYVFCNYCEKSFTRGDRLESPTNADEIVNAALASTGRFINIVSPHGTNHFTLEEAGNIAFRLCQEASTDLNVLYCDLSNISKTLEWSPELLSSEVDSGQLPYWQAFLERSTVIASNHGTRAYASGFNLFITPPSILPRRFSSFPLEQFVFVDYFSDFHSLPSLPPR